MLKRISLATLLVAATFTLPAIARVAAVAALATTIPVLLTPAEAKDDKGGKGGKGDDHGGKGGKGDKGGKGGSKGVPGPIAGAGLPFLLLAGGYVLVRRYRNRSTAETRSPTIG
ncbi:hypothetical protein AAII07_52805 [Microvirga sp. 0TCS3.31]